MSRALLTKVRKKPFKVLRESEGGRDPDTGDWIEGSSEELTVKGNEQPYPANEKKMLPESFRSKDVKMFFTLSDLNSLDEGSSTVPDKVVIRDSEYEVKKKESFQMGVRRHYEYTLVRTGESAGMGSI